MEQSYIQNTEYEILTPSGWQDFEGMIYNKDTNALSKRLLFEDGTTICATNEHRFFSNNKEITVEKLEIGIVLDGLTTNKKIIDIELLTLVDTYDIFNANKHLVAVNDVISHQCDEFAFVQPNIAGNFWASISPTLSTGGRAIITSTPNSDEDTFATIWKESQEKTDEYGNVILNGLGRNGFFGFRAYWEEHPDRDEEWKQKELNKIGEENFRREFQCLTQDAVLTIKWPSGKIEKRSIGEIIGLLS
jgi:hypothetical protein